MFFTFYSSWWWLEIIEAVVEHPFSAYTRWCRIGKVWRSDLLLRVRLFKQLKIFNMCFLSIFRQNFMQLVWR